VTVDPAETIHNRNAGNCIYQFAKATDDEVCYVSRCLEQLPDQDEVQNTSEILVSDAPARAEEQFVTERELLNARFTVPQLVQTQVLQAESLAEDFQLLGQRLRAEVPNATERDEAIRYLELAFMLAVRGLSYG